MSSDPFDDYWRNRNQALDRKDAAAALDLQFEIDRLRTSEALHARYSTGGSPRKPSPAATPPSRHRRRYARDRFIASDIETVCQLHHEFDRRFGIFGRTFLAPTEAEFEDAKDGLLDAIERHLPPSYAPEMFGAISDAVFGGPVPLAGMFGSLVYRRQMQVLADLLATSRFPPDKHDRRCGPPGHSARRSRRGG